MAREEGRLPAASTKLPRSLAILSDVLRGGFRGGGIDVAQVTFKSEDLSSRRVEGSGTSSYALD
jgi:hypothetical protein